MHVIYLIVFILENGEAWFSVPPNKEEKVIIRCHRFNLIQFSKRGSIHLNSRKYTLGPTMKPGHTWTCVHAPTKKEDFDWSSETKEAPLERNQSSNIWFLFKIIFGKK